MINLASIVPINKKSLDERLKIIDNLSDKINGKIGKTVIGRIGRIPEIKEKLKIKFVSTPSLEVNEAMGGGFPVGKTSIVAGKPDSGKTSLLLSTIAKAQKENPEIIAAWLETEGSISDKQLDMFGIDSQRFIYLEQFKNAEQVLDQMESICKSGVTDIMVVNSLKMLLPKEEEDKSFESSSIGLQARLNAKLQRKIIPTIAENDIALIYVCHLSNEIGKLYGDPLSITGGESIKFGSMMTLDLRKKCIQEADPVSREGYMKIGVSVVKNHCVFDRKDIYRKTDYFVEINRGIETILPLIDMAITKGFLTKAGAFIKEIDINTGEPKVVDGIKYQWQGTRAFREFLLNTPDYLKELEDKVSGNFTKSMTKEEVDTLFSIDPSEITPEEILEETQEEEPKKKISRKKSA